MLVEDALGGTRIFELDATKVIVGRAANADLAIEDRRASHSHGAITR